MSSGRVLLSVRGREDLPISGRPQYSYYLKNFARSEPYEYLFVDNALATIVQGRTPTYGDTIAFDIPRRGDLLSKLFLKIVLPPSYLYSNLIRTKTDTFNLYSIIEFVDLEIGGQLVQRLTGEYILNYINLYYSSNDIDFFQNVTEMKIKDLRKLYSQFGQFVLLPIPFYFWDNKGNELPLISLTRQHVKVNLKLAPKPPVTGLPDLTDVTISTEYILLGSEATKKVFIDHGLVYRISQIQMNSAVISNSETKKIIDLDFQNPVREILVCIQPRTYQDISNSNFYNYFGNYRNSFLNFRNPETGWYLSEHHISGMSLKFNNNEYINEEGSGSAQMLSSVLPQKYYANSDNIQQFRGYIYPFVIDPLARNPQGHINMSRILKKQLTLHMNTSQLSRSVRVYASSYNIMTIRDGVSGLMFMNPSHYNPKIVLGESSEVVEGIPPTDLETLSPDQGFYYAIKIDEGHEIVGIQFHTEGEPQFGGDRELHDDQFSYLLNTNDTFMSNVTPIDTSEYTPGTVSQLLQNVIEVPNEQDAIRADKYHITTSNNYIYTSNFGFVTNIRLAIKVHESVGSLGTGALTSYSGQYSNLLTDTTFTLYKSSKFFTADDIDTWIADPSTVSEVRNIRGQNTYESPGYYYSALATVNASGGITDYTKVHFARTYNFGFSFSVLAPTTDNYSRDTNISSVSFKVSNLSGSGSVRVYLGSSERTVVLFYNEGDIELDINFVEQIERGLKTYSVLISPDGSRNITKNFQVIAGGTAPPLYHAFQYLPPEGSSEQVSIVAIQGYSPAANVANLTSYQMVTYNTVPLSNLNTEHTSSGSPLSNIYFEDIIPTINRYYYNGTFAGTYPLGATVINPLIMGENNYFYTTSKESITFYVVALDTSIVPDDNYRVRLYSSSEEFGTPSVGDWVNGAVLKEFKLSDLTSGSRILYNSVYRITRPTGTDFSFRGGNYMTKYYIPFDTTSPVMTITYAGELKVDGDSIQIERFTPTTNFVDYLNNYTYVNVQIDDETALITESNNISNTVPGFYTLSFTATDPYLNSSTQTFTITVADEEPPEVVSNIFTGDRLGHTLDVLLNELATGVIRENGTIVKEVLAPATSTFQFIRTPVDPAEEYIPLVYTGEFTDVFGNQGTFNLGTYLPDNTEPILTVTYDGTTYYDGDNIDIERYSTPGTFIATATDEGDALQGRPLDIQQTGDTIELVQSSPGTVFARNYSVTDFAGNSNIVALTVTLVDTIPPTISVYNGSTLLTNGQSVTMERLTPQENFIDNVSALHGVTNEQYATIVTTFDPLKPFQNTIEDYYIVNFKANDGVNDSIETVQIIVNVTDTIPISLTNKTFTGYKNTVSFSADMSEIGTVEIKRDGTTVNTWTSVTSFSENFTGLPDGPPSNTWSVQTTDNFGQVASYIMGTHTSDSTPPELFIYKYDGITRVFDTDTIEYERTTNFVEAQNNAIDSVDGSVTVVKTGDVPNSLSGLGETFVRTFTATDSQDNSNVAVITYEVVDTIEPYLVSNSVTASDVTTEIEVTVTVNESAALTLKRGSTTVYTWSGNRTFGSYIETNLTEGQTYNYTVEAVDPAGNSNSFPIGSATVGDFTEPSINLLNYTNSPIYDGSQVSVERYQQFTELILTGRATDNVDGAIDVISLTAFPDVTQRHGTITERQFRATDTAGNSNTITINFIISDSVDPVFNTVTPVYNEIDGRVTISGDMSEECTVSVHTGSHSGTLLDSVSTSGVSNAFILTSTTVDRYYYIRADDGNNTEDYSVLERPLSTDLFITLTFDGTNNTSNIRAYYNNILQLGASSVVIELSTNDQFTPILDTQTVPSGTTYATSSLIPVDGTWSLRTYYTRIRSTGFVTSTFSKSIYAGVKPDPPAVEYNLFISTPGRIEIDHLDGPFASVAQPESGFPADPFNYLFDNQFDYSSHDVRFNGSNIPMVDFYWGPDTYAAQDIYVWMNQTLDNGTPAYIDSLHNSTITARYNGSTVVTYTANTSSTTLLSGPPYDHSSWRTTFEVTAINYTVAYPPNPPFVPNHTVLAFHHGNFDTKYNDSSVSDAASNGRIFANTPTGTYSWGTLTSKSTTSSQTTYNWSPVSAAICGILLIAGGGGGGRRTGGGSGAGGVVFSVDENITGTQTVVVGAGGSGSTSRYSTGSKGYNSTALNYTALGGGGGASDSNSNQATMNGGSGGGSEWNNSTSGVAKQPDSASGGYGNAGGSSDSSREAGAGGGGAGTTGTDTNGYGYGGDGIYEATILSQTYNFLTTFGSVYGEPIDGEIWFAGGGGGGTFSGTYQRPTSGKGGGGNGSDPVVYDASINGLPHTGGGAGGEGPDSYNAGNGGSGICLIYFTT